MYHYFPDFCIRSHVRDLSAELTQGCPGPRSGQGPSPNRSHVAGVADLLRRLPALLCAARHPAPGKPPFLVPTSGPFQAPGPPPGPAVQATVHWHTSLEPHCGSLVVSGSLVVARAAGLSAAQGRPATVTAWGHRVSTRTCQ